MRILLASVSFLLMLSGCKGCEQQKPVDPAQPTVEPTVEPAKPTSDKPGEVKEEVKPAEVVNPTEVKPTEEVVKQNADTKE